MKAKQWVKSRVFQSGNSQAIRIPKEFQLNSAEVEITSVDGGLIIRKVGKSLRQAFETLSEMEDAFPAGREQPQNQDREPF